MKKIHLWSVESNGEGALSAELVKAVDTSETEQMLEDLFVQSPDLLMNGLALVGRQVATGGGPLDLLGIDQDGRVVVFELKRGVLTREAVAQVLDYASDLGKLGADTLSRLLEEHSGRGGIEEISDFADWYGREYPNSDHPLAEAPRMVLVGLGVDDRARRIVNFLVESGVDIQLLTFHAFSVDGKLMLARQVESRPPSAPSQTPTQTKEGNRKILHDTAQSLGVKDFLLEVADFIDEQLPAYRWPGKTAYSFSLQEKTSEGRPTLRSYVTIYLNPKQPGTLTLMLSPRAANAAAEAMGTFCDRVPEAVCDEKSYSALELILQPGTWPSVTGPLEGLLTSMVSGWKAAASAEPGSETAE